MKQMTGLCALLSLFSLLGIGCSKESESREGEAYSPNIDPAAFVAAITNQYLPLTPGKTFHYQGVGADSVIINDVNVMTQTKMILGVTCVVVWDRVWEDSELVEETYDWFAQDSSGNVWYFGEDSKEYANGVVVSTEGSWEAGVDDAQPGIVMEGSPQVGDTYRLEYYEDEAEDMAEVLSLSDSASVPYGDFQNCLKTKEWSPLEPGVIEHKYYAPTVGEVFSITVSGGSEAMELIGITTE